MDPAVATVLATAIGAVPATVAAFAAYGARGAARGARAAAHAKTTNDAGVEAIREALGQILETAVEARDLAASAEEKITTHLEAHANAAPALALHLHSPHEETHHAETL